MSTLSRLLIRNVSKGQTLSYLLANFIGLTIILCALQLHADLSPAMDTDSREDDLSYFGNDYLVITKRLGTLSALGMGESRFNVKEIEDIASQPWAKNVGNFKAADFSVYASVNIAGKGMSTAMFLEAVPDEFIDKKPANWSFDPLDPYSKPIPVIIPRDYLALYNFGFAPSRGLPQLSDEVVTSVPISIIMVGNGMREAVDARIVGFSSRLNTIAAPQEFIDWANDRFSTPNSITEEESHSPSRLIVSTTTSGDPAINDYLRQHGYEEAGNNIETGKASFFLTVVTGVIAGIGGVIAILAVIILLLSVFLLIQKNRVKIHQLMMLGYSPKTVSAYYLRLIGGINAGVLILSLAALWVLSLWWRNMLEALDIDTPSLWGTVVTGVAIMVIITVFNFFIVTRMIKKCFR